MIGKRKWNPWNPNYMQISFHDKPEAISQTLFSLWMPTPFSYKYLYQVPSLINASMPQMPFIKCLLSNGLGSGMPSSVGRWVDG